MLENISLIVFGVILIVQELRIATLRTKVMFLDRQRKSIMRSIDLQNNINDKMINTIEHLTDLCGDVIINKFNNMVNDK